MGLKGMSMLSREAKAARGGLSVKEVLRRKLNRTSAVMAISGLIALSSMGMPADTQAMDFGNQVESAVDHMSRRAINKTADTVMDIFAGYITGKTLDAAAQADQEQKQMVSGKVRDIRNELESIGFSPRNVQINEENGKIVVSGALDAPAKNAVMTVVRKYFGSNDILDRVWAYRPGQGQAGQTSGPRQGP